MTEGALREDDLASATATALKDPLAPDRFSAEAAGASSGFGTFRSLRYRDYRLVWFGTLFSSSGQWIQQITVGWLAYQLTGSAFLLGAINGVRSLPLLAFGPIGGVAADRVDRKLLMLSTQVFLLVLTAIMGTIILVGRLEVWHLFAFTLLTGVAWAFNMPVRQSIMPKLVPEADLMNAMALSSAGFNVTRILGPSLAGILIAKLGGGENFLLQSVAYVGVTITIIQMRVPDMAHADSGSIRANLAEGLSYVWHHDLLRSLMILALVPVVLAWPYAALMPIFAKEVLHHGAGGFGLLMAASGVGAVIGTLVIASMSSMERKGFVLLGSIFAMGASLMLFSLSRSFELSCLLLVLVGATQMIYATTNQTLLQLTIPDDLRGRVMGIYMLNQGLLPLGSLLAGAMAGFIGAPKAVFILGGIVCALAVAFLVLSKNIRRA